MSEFPRDYTPPADEPPPGGRPAGGRAGTVGAPDRRVGEAMTVTMEQTRLVAADLVSGYAAKASKEVLAEVLNRAGLTSPEDWATLVGVLVVMVEAAHYAGQGSVPLDRFLNLVKAT